MKRKIIEFKDYSFQYRVQSEPTLKNINLTIYEEDLNEGIHKIEVVQYHNNKTSGTPITYKNCNYKIEKR